MSARFYRNPDGTRFAGGLPCQAPSEGGQPFASSPFAHPIPQSRRRAWRFVQRFLKWRAAESHYFGSAHSRSHHIRLPTRLRNPDPLNASSFRDIWPVLGFRELQTAILLEIFRAQLANAVYDVTDPILRSRPRDFEVSPTQCRTRSFR